MPIPEKSKAIIQNGNVFEIGEIITPTPNPEEVLIKVHYAGVNRPDLFQSQGNYPPPPNASPILGLEVTGEIAAIGNKVTTFKIGDKVCALLTGGGYSEYATAYHGCCLPIPHGLSMSQAAALPENIFTCYTNIIEDCNLKPNETLLVHGGASGIGTCAIQIAKAIGAKTIATVGTNKKVEYCRQLGCDLVINYHAQDFEAIVKANGGADVILDMVAGDYVQKNINILNEKGRLCFIAFLRGSKVEVNLVRVMLRRLKITGSTLRSRANEEKARLAQNVLRDIWPLIEQGKYKVFIDQIFDLKDAAQALATLERGSNSGKLVLKVI